MQNRNADNNINNKLSDDSRYRIKERNIMKRLFTFIASALITASAGASTYYANYAQLNVYPEGKGKVYLDQTSTEPSDDKWTDQAEDQAVEMAGTFYMHAKPADGYQLAGFSEATFDDMGQPVFNTDIVTTENPGGIPMSDSQINGDDEAKVRASMPLEPNRVYWALFTVVKAGYFPQHDQLGKVSISKVCNDRGDQVTITATPDTEFDPTAKFDYWIKESTGEKLTENPLTVTVDKLENYKAHFSADKALVWNFDENGEYKIWYNESKLNTNSFPDNVWNVTITPIDSLDNGNRVNGANIELLSHYMWNNYTPAILYGKGEATIILSGDTKADLPETPEIVKVDTPVNTSDLPVSFYYYTVDIENQKFELIPDNTLLESGIYYIQFAADKFLKDVEKPAVLYWNADAAMSVLTPQQTEAYKDAKVYNLNGMEVKSLGKGIYIINGKKFLNK